MIEQIHFCVSIPWLLCFGELTSVAFFLGCPWAIGADLGTGRRGAEREREKCLEVSILPPPPQGAAPSQCLTAVHLRRPETGDPGSLPKSVPTPTRDFCLELLGIRLPLRLPEITPWLGFLPFLSCFPSLLPVSVKNFPQSVACA